MMMKYFRRQVINILQELCFQSFEASKMKLAQFRETMSHMASMLPGNMISDRNIALALEKKSALLKDFMHPAALGLDMIAYSVSIPTKLVTVDFIPDWISNEFNSLLRSLEDCSGVTSISMKSEKRYILYRVSEMNVERETPHTRFGLLKYLHVDIRSKMTAVAFFEEEFYKQFAERQVSRLLDIIANQMSSGILFIS
uniref:Adaptor protein MecA n=1 Tax=Angiostrongylus cantonensis TaxID=6313 RepID=A0A0K0D5D8_ANGCA